MVVLHGTDTLAHSAAALALALHNLPCPVVLTGANQPPNEHSVREQGILSSQSDAWPNVLQSLRFIESFGHRYTEVFVCFGDTIHLAINLRKLPIAMLPPPSSDQHRALAEPFFYRNLGHSLRQYAFRNIDGLYCNNLYPLAGNTTHLTIIDDGASRLRHYRPSPLRVDRPISRSVFAPGVHVVVASPTTVASEPAPGAMRVLLIEGYNSGTFPTIPDHPFTSLLRTSLRDAIPVVLVARSGLVPSETPYEAKQVDDQDIPIVRLFGVLVETAAPLLSVVLGRIADAEWERHTGEATPELLRRRIAAIRRELTKHQREEGGVFGLLLGNVLDQREQSERFNHSAQGVANDYRAQVTELFVEARGKVPKHVKRTSAFDDSKTVLLRQHFLWLLLEMTQPNRVSGAGPDGLALLNEMGFTWGSQVWDSVGHQTKRRGVETPADPTRQRQERIQDARRHTQTVSNFLSRYGVADVKSDLAVEMAATADQHAGGTLTLDVRAVKHGGARTLEELYAVVGPMDGDAEFIRSLRRGVALNLFESECVRHVEDGYRALLVNSWQKTCSPLDWLLVGVYKAVVCRVLRSLRFDPWVERCVGASRIQEKVLRRSIDVHMRVADVHQVGFELRYVSRDGQRVAGAS